MWDRSASSSKDALYLVFVGGIRQAFELNLHFDLRYTL